MRGLLARKETRALRQQKAAVNIQTAWRRYKMRQLYHQVLHNITSVQVRDSQPDEPTELPCRGQCHVQLVLCA